MQIVDLFAGIGGFSLAGHMLGWDTVQMVEINPFCQKILSHHFPNAKIHNDVKTFGIEVLKKSRWDPAIGTILCGGFPCQPFSVSGKQLGTEDERHLWPEMLRAIREIQPRWVVGENVRGLINWNGGLVFDEVQADLEAAGYEVQPFLLPACGVYNAPHRRDRIWFIAYSDHKRAGSQYRSFQEEDGKVPERNNYAKPCNASGRATSNTGLQRQEKSTKQTMGAKQLFKSGDATDSENVGLQRGKDKRSITGIRQGREEQSCGFVCPDWQNFPTQSPVCNGNDGISARLDTDSVLEAVGRKVNKRFNPYGYWRNESIKAGGNAIVPQVAIQIFKAIEQYEQIQNIES